MIIRNDASSHSYCALLGRRQEAEDLLLPARQAEEAFSRCFQNPVMHLITGRKSYKHNKTIRNMDEKHTLYFDLFRAHIEKHVHLEDSHLVYIKDRFLLKKVKRRSILLEPGTICRYEHFVVSGLFQSSIVDESGKTHTLNFPHENWWVSDFKSFNLKAPSIMSIEALEDSILLEISRASLDELLANSPGFATYFRILSENASIAANERIIHQLSQTAEQRYELFCQKYGRLKDRLSQKRIASFLGISPEYYNQIEKRRKTENLI